MSHSADSVALGYPRSVPMHIWFRLSVMMFLQYAVWGAGFVAMGAFILANVADGSGGGMFGEGFIGRAYATAAIAGIITPFFVGMVADRFFASQHLLFLLHLVGAGVLYYLSTVTSQQVFYFTLIGYFLCYMPTLSLTNSLSMHHLADPGRQFPMVRVWGTIGWIVAGLFIGWLRVAPEGIGFKIDEFLGYVFNPSIALGTMSDASASVTSTTRPMMIAAALQACMAFYCLLLPHTPPKSKGEAATFSSILGLDALGLMKQPSFAVFVIGSMLICIPLQFYYGYTNAFLTNIGVENATSKMTYGQMSEIFFMLLMPFFFVRLGVKWMLLIGMACWVTRYLFFAFGDTGNLIWMLYGGILLHGICYDFFFVTGQIYIDKKADSRIRGAAQGFIAFATLGVGNFIGAEFSGYVERVTRAAGAEAWQEFWLGALLHRIGFQPPSGPGIDWFQFWMVPALCAAVVMVLFALLFHDRVRTGGGEA